MKDIWGCFLIIGLSLILAFVVNAVSPNGIPLFGQWDEKAGVIMAGTTDAHAVKAKEINNPLKVLRLIESGSVILVDVRRADIYEQGHLPGALSFPLYDFETNKKRFLSTLVPEDDILVYCSGITCEDSHTFASKLIKMGFEKVTVYAGGFAEWQEMEFDMETGQTGSNG
ncbi:MAG: rhodanese-like domain-containing protein [Desulfobacterales bacterium]|nr:rhodanese-like domain-containing protein [Desulfobacterales bacterium]